jgi:hypothetical protein
MNYYLGASRMNNQTVSSAFTLGALICIGLSILGYLLADSLPRMKAMDRTVSVKGLSEKEVPADIAIWPVRFNIAENDLVKLFAGIEEKNARVVEFLKARGFEDAEITISPPAVQDRHAQGYVNIRDIPFRYTANSTITVYTRKVDAVVDGMKQLIELGKHGVVILGEDYDPRAEFLFTGLNDLKPEMIEEATRNAREVAEKFAHDSQSRLGKIRTASQGQFSIDNRDSNTPYIKKVRVVSTVQYYLVD